MKDEGYEVHEEYLLNIKSNNPAYIRRCLHMLKDIADAHYIFLNDACDVTSSISLRKGSRIFQVWHACGAFKKFGMSTADLIFGADRRTQEKFPNYRNLSYVTVSSPEVSWAYEEAMNLKGTDNRIVDNRNQPYRCFYDKNFIENARELFTPYSPGPFQKVILYAPTFRGRVAKAKTPDCLDIPAMKKALEMKYILLLKHHPFVKKRPENSRGLQRFRNGCNNRSGYR